MRASRRTLLVPAVVVAVATLGMAGCTPSGPTADYRFQNSLASSVGSPPDMISYTKPSNAASTFVSEVVDGTTRKVLRFPQGNGLTFGPSYPTVDFTTYSVATLFRFDTVTSYRRVLDVKGGFAESGLYNRNGSLDYYPLASGSGAPIVANQYVQVVLTRDSAKKVTGYVNGVQQFSFTDSTDEAVISSDLFTGIRLYWFSDNQYGGTVHTEESAGAVARIRLWNRSLSAGEVSGLSRLG
jgi:hypothetical protein